ncbi:MAG TPA: polysaccharide deacetylase family protein [Rhodanobacteraceae bacterium]|nr:polysaccharide deacetylase family protein [Rhodanobacteraceae bacterium]
MDQNAQVIFSILAASGWVKRLSSIRLTFDDGPGPSTAALLDVLHMAGYKATFFLLGRNQERNMSVVVRMIREGHAVGNHAYSHAKPGDLADAMLEEELEATDALIREAYRLAGCAAPTRIPVRLPYGIQEDDPRLPLLQKLGRKHVGWTAIIDDWRRPEPPVQRLVEDMLRHIEDCVARGVDAVLCLHDSSHQCHERPATVEAVRLLLASPRCQALFDRDDTHGVCR